MLDRSRSRQKAPRSVLFLGFLNTLVCHDPCPTEKKKIGTGRFLGWTLFEPENWIGSSRVDGNRLPPAKESTADEPPPPRKHVDEDRFMQTQSTVFLDPSPWETQPII